jgi:hypothetical protein
MKRRSFLQSIIRAAGIVALAPQIAFRAPALRIPIPNAQANGIGTHTLEDILNARAVGYWHVVKFQDIKDLPRAWQETAGPALQRDLIKPFARE